MPSFGRTWYRSGQERPWPDAHHRKCSVRAGYAGSTHLRGFSWLADKASHWSRHLFSKSWDFSLQPLPGALPYKQVLSHGFSGDWATLEESTTGLFHAPIVSDRSQRLDDGRRGSFYLHRNPFCQQPTRPALKVVISLHKRSGLVAASRGPAAPESSGAQCTCWPMQRCAGFCYRIFTILTSSLHFPQSLSVVNAGMARFIANAKQARSPKDRPAFRVGFKSEATILACAPSKGMTGICSRSI